MKKRDNKTLKTLTFNQACNKIIEYITEEKLTHKVIKSMTIPDDFDLSKNLEVVPYTIEEIEKNPKLCDYQKLKDSLSYAKVDDYRMVRKKFNDFIEAFFFSKYTYIFKKGKEQAKEYEFIETDIPYFVDILIGFSSEEFQAFRKHSFEVCKPHYIINQVDKFLEFVEKYFVADLEQYEEYKELIYNNTNYRWLSSKMLSDKIKDFCFKIDEGFLFPISCFCSERKLGICKQSCKSFLQDHGCKLPIHEEKKPHKDFRICISRCFRQKHFESGWLTDEEKAEWIKYAYDKLTNAVKYVDDILEIMDEIKTENGVEKIYGYDISSNSEYILALDYYISSQLYKDAEFKKKNKEYLMVKNKNTLKNNKKTGKIEKEYNDYVKKKKIEIISNWLMETSPAAGSIDVCKKAEELYSLIEDEYQNADLQSDYGSQPNNPAKQLLDLAIKIKEDE